MSDAPTTSTAHVDPPRGSPTSPSWDFWTVTEAIAPAASDVSATHPGLPFYPERTFEDSPLAPGPGYYAVTRQDASGTPAAPRAVLLRPGRRQHRRPQPGAQRVLRIDDLDGRPRHFRLRSIVSKGFTPKHISAVEEQVKHAATELVDRIIAEHPDRTADFVEAFAGPFPLEIICSMMGIPAGDTRQIFDWTNVILGVGDPEFGDTYERLLEVALSSPTRRSWASDDARIRPTTSPPP